jgi:signal peptidase I
VDPRQRPASPQAPSPVETEDLSESQLTRAGLLRLDELESANKRRSHQQPARPGLRTPREEGRRYRRRFVGALLTVGTKAMIVTLLAWGLLFNFSEVRGSSMEPGIHDRDRILVDHVSYLLNDVSRGDVVVLRYPLDPSLDYIKRVIGLPGDEVRIEHGQVLINGEALTEPYVDAASIEPWTSMITTVRAGHYFVLGDNRKRSSDSREFGQVPFEYLRGKVRLRLWPPSRLGMIR